MDEKEYVFEFTVNGSITIKAKSKEEAEEALDKITDDYKLLEESDTHMYLSKCVGTYNEDGSITYFEPQEVTEDK